MHAAGTNATAIGHANRPQPRAVGTNTLAQALLAPAPAYTTAAVAAQVAETADFVRAANVAAAWAGCTSAAKALLLYW